MNQKNIAKSNEQLTKFDYLSAIKEQLKINETRKLSYYLLENYHTKTNQSQKILLDSLQEFFIESKLNLTFGSKFGFLDACYVKLLLYLYQDLEILSDEQLIIEWYSKQKQSLLTTDSAKIDLEGKRHAVAKLDAFMKWLEESESSEDE